MFLLQQDLSKRGVLQVEIVIAKIEYRTRFKAILVREV